MKRNVVKLFKYVMLMGITMMVTIVLYRLIRGSPGELSGIPEQAKLRHFDVRIKLISISQFYTKL